jgi:NADH-quinone oxidoreductase subunit N
MIGDIMTATLTLTDYLAIGPLLILLGLSLVLVLLEAFLETNKKIISLVTFLGLAFALFDACISPVSDSPLLTPWLKFDSFSRFFAILFIGIGLYTTLISSPFFKRFEATRGEYYFFLVSSLFGLLLISAANDFLTLFLGLETLSIALYVLCGYIKKWNVSHEAAFKYFLLGAISTSFLLFGIALIYGATGSLRFDTLMQTTKALSQTNSILLTGGVALVTLSLLFKAAVVPFHIWAPDVYAGAPTPVTAFMAVGTKAGAFAALIRIFLLILTNYDPLWHKMIAFLAYPTLIYANFVAMRQVQLRRFFAYSGISHAGFLLIPLAAGGMEAAPSMLFYIVVYTIATLGSFAVLAFLDNKSEGVTFRDLKGLFHSSPLLASIFALCLLTLGGIPPTIGFFAKFYLLKVAFSAGYYGLVVVGLLTTILSAFYYLRIVTVMFSERAEEETKPIRSMQAGLAGLASFVSIVVLSFYPEPLLNLFTKVCG